MKFCAFGPFKLEQWSGQDVDKLYRLFEDACPGLEHTSGVYVVVAGSRATLSPKYVGKTDGKFGSRLITHFNKTLKKREQSLIDDAALFEQIFYSHKGGFHLYLITEMTPTGRFTKRGNIKSKSIDRLEHELILAGSARSKLWNMRRTKSRQPGLASLLNWQPDTATSAEKDLIGIFGLKG